MTTGSCTTTSLMPTRHQRAMCPSLKNYNNEHLPFDHWEVRSSNAPEWTRQARKELCFAMNGLYFCFMLDRCLYFSISAYAAITNWMNIEIRLSNESYTGLCHNVTQVVTWPITSYGGAGGKSPSRAPINKFGKKRTSFQYWNWKTHQLI